MRQLAAQDVREDLGVAVRVHGEARGGRDDVFVEDADGPEVLVGGRVVVGEVEAAVAGQPAGGGDGAGGGSVGFYAGVFEDGGHLAWYFWGRLGLGVLREDVMRRGLVGLIWKLGK